jgi:hypothetical protein
MADNEKSFSSSEMRELLVEQQKMFAAQMAEMARQNAEQTKALVAELRKPTVMEQRQLDVEEKALLAKNEERKANAEAFRIKKEEERWLKRTCSHEHRNGNTHCVFVTEPRITNGVNGYILCQKNQCIIRPGTKPANDDSDAIYDTAQFNRLFQSLPTQEMFG